MMVNNKSKRGQVWYFTSVMLILIGFAFFGIMLLNHSSLTGQAISHVDLPDTCSDTNIRAVWDSVFWEDSTGISILKNDTIFDGRCIEYFAIKHNPNEFNDTYTLYGYTSVEGGKNVSYVIAERINFTNIYWDGFLLNVTHIENVSALYPTKDSSFAGLYTQARTETVDSASVLGIFNESFEMNQTETFFAENYLGDSAFGFSNDYDTSNYDVSVIGKILVNYGYEIFSLVSTPLGCAVSTNCDSWPACVGGVQNRTCTNSSACAEDVVFNVTRPCSDCVSNWSIGSWSPCINGTQKRNVIDLHDCNVTVGMPVTNKSCNATCVPDWVCGGWTPVECPASKVQTRNCTDNNACNEPFKLESKSCGVGISSTPASSGSGFSTIFLIIISIVVLAIIGLIVWLAFLAKGKGEGGGVSSGGFSPPGNPPMAPRPTGFRPAIKRIARPVRQIIPNKPRPMPARVIPKPKSTTPKIIPKQKPRVQPRNIPRHANSVWSNLRRISEK